MKKNIGITIFSYYKDEDFLALCLRGLAFLIKKYPQYNVRVFIVDDKNMKQKINVDNLPFADFNGNIEILYTDFDRKGNLNGFDCMYGMVSTYKHLVNKYNLDYIMKYDSDCFLNELDFIWKTENALKEAGISLDRLMQTGSSFCNICCQGCAQTMTKNGVNALASLFYNMKMCANEHAKILRKRVELGYYEDRVMSMLLEMVPGGIRFDIKTLPGCLGHLDCFTNPDADFTKYTSLTFKAYTIGGGAWTREKAYSELKKYVEKIFNGNQTSMNKKT